MKIIRINATWCSGCLILKGIWKEIEKEFPNNEYIDYDYDLDEEEIEKYNIKDIVPVVIIKKDNQEIIRIEGEKTKKEILDVLRSLSWKK